jgi:hypothetical protein
MSKFWTISVVRMLENSRQIQGDRDSIWLPKIDGRRREARLMRETREQLFAHCGGSPSAAQRLLIERVIALRVRLGDMDADLAAGRGVNDRLYLRWSNALARVLARLGKAVEPKPDFKSYWNRPREASEAAK